MARIFSKDDRRRNKVEARRKLKTITKKSIQEKIKKSLKSAKSE